MSQASSGAENTRRRAFFILAAILSLVFGLLFIGVTALTIGLWLAHRNALTTPVSDLSFFALGAIIIGMGFAVQLRAPERKLAGGPAGRPWASRPGSCGAHREPHRTPRGSTALPRCGGHPGGASSRTPCILQAWTRPERSAGGVVASRRCSRSRVRRQHARPGAPRWSVVLLRAVPLRRSSGGNGRPGPRHRSGWHACCLEDTGLERCGSERRRLRCHPRPGINRAPQRSRSVRPGLGSAERNVGSPVCRGS